MPGVMASWCLMSASPVKGVTQEHPSSLPKAPPKHQGTDPAPCPPAQTGTPALAEVSSSHQTLLLAGTNGSSLPQFPHLENGCSSTHPPTLSCSARPWVVLFNTGGVPTSFCSFPLPRIYLDGDAGSAGSWPQQSLPGTQPSPLPSPAGCCGGVLQLSIPPGALAPHVTRLGASGEGSVGGSGNTTLRTLHAPGLPSFFLEPLSWEGPSLRLPINLAA